MRLMGRRRPDSEPRPATAVERYCLSCSQALLGVTLRRCPECGREYDPDDPSTTGGPLIPIRVYLATPIRWVCRLWTVPVVLVPLACFLALVGPFPLRMIALLLVPFAIVTMLLVLFPDIPLSARDRVLGFLCPPVALITALTYWPIHASFALHRTLLDKAANAVAAGGPRGGGRIGLFHYRQVRVGAAAYAQNSIAFEIGGNSAMSVYLVRDDPSTPWVWHNRAVEIPLGGNWYLFQED